MRKVKRNVWCIIEPSPPPVQQKKRKLCKAVKPRKPRQRRNCALKQSFPALEQTEESITVQNTKPTASKRRRANSPTSNEARDSGVHSDGSSSSGSGYSGSSDGSNGSFTGGNSGTGGSGAQGNAGDGDEGDKKKEIPQWHLPGKQNIAAKTEKKKRGAAAEEEGNGSQEKMEVDCPGSSGFQMFLPSKVDIAEQCHSPGVEEPSTTSTKVAC